MSRSPSLVVSPQTYPETAALPHRGAADLRMPLIYELWLATWERALAALATATRSRALSTNEAAAHRAVIDAERETVTMHFTLLLGRELPLPPR